MSAVPQPAPQPAASRSVRLVVLHCSATPSGKPIAASARLPGIAPAVATIDAWHALRGFRRGDVARERFNPLLGSIGYHYVVDLDGAVHAGRHPSEQGAHVAGFNWASLGVCLVGGAERDARYTAAQWAALRELVQRLCHEHRLPAIRPINPREGYGVCGHRDLSPDANRDGQVQPHEWLKTCPGFDVGAWLAGGMEPPPRHLLQEPPR